MSVSVKNDLVHLIDEKVVNTINKYRVLDVKQNTPYSAFSELFEVLGDQWHHHGHFNTHLRMHYLSILSVQFKLTLGKCLALVPNDPDDNQVWAVVNSSADRPLNRYAMKVVSLRYVNRLDRGSVSAQFAALYKESQTLMFLKHKNIMRVIEEFGLPDPTTGADCLLRCSLMEVMNGSLESLLRNQPLNYLSDRKCGEWFIQIAGAVHYLHTGLIQIHNLWISHMAIRPANILYKCVYDSKGVIVRYIYKLTDFEESICFTASDTDAIPAGHVVQRNPIGRANEYAVNCPTKPQDIYCLGYSLAISLVGMKRLSRFWRYVTNTAIRPHPRAPDSEFTAEELNIFAFISSETKSLVLQTFKEWQLRPTIEQIMDTDFIKGLAAIHLYFL